MRHLCSSALLVLALGATLSAQITIIPAVTFVPARPAIDMDQGLAVPGPVVGNEPFFVIGGVLQASIINDPGVHTPGDALSANVSGNALVSVNNMLEVAAPSGPMDNHAVGAGFGLVFDSVYTQFKYLCVDQVNHDTQFETYLGGVLQNTASFNTSAFGATAFPYPAFCIEDLGGFDEIRIKALQTGGFGLDDIQVGIAAPPSFQQNSTAISLDINGLTTSVYAPVAYPGSLNERITLNVSGIAAPYDAIFSADLPVGDLGIIPGNLTNLNPFGPASFLLFGGAFSAPATLPTAGLPVVLGPARNSIQGAVLDPMSPVGVTLSAAVTYIGFPCPAGSDFESGFPSDWTDPSGTATNTWTVNSGGTGSIGTGPTAANGGASYLYAETSIANPAVFSFDTCVTDIASLQNFNLDFALSRIGVEIGTLEIFVDDGSGAFASLAATYTGPDATQAQGATEWSQESISLLPFITGSGSIAVRFQYTSGNSFTGDLALDDISIN